jgi:glycosyltransferase involved in cell wall biosynthesis
MRVCLVYDCLYPHTVGGAERWYRNLAERLASNGHEVTYLTLRQWDREDQPQLAGVEVHAVGPRMRLYAASGRRRVLPAVVFGLGVALHLLRHGRRYEIVHTASFPYFSLLAAALVRPLWGLRVVVDWHEVWTREYWREYLGRFAGDVGWLIQRLCAQVPQEAFCFSRLHAARLQEEGLEGEITLLSGEYVGGLEPGAAESGVEQEPEPLIVFAGRLIPEKRATLGVEAVAAARHRIPGLRAVFYGDGPERARVLEAIEQHGLEGIVEAPGFVSGERVEAHLRRALCMLLPSRREGYGMAVVEASACGTPSVVVAGPDNAATELISESINGVVVGRPDAQLIADAILHISRGGDAMRHTTIEWFAANAARLSLEGSLDSVLAAYAPREEEWVVPDPRWSRTRVLT